MISIFKKIVVELLTEVVTPPHVVSVDANGLFTKTPFGLTQVAAAINIDGGFANAKYIAGQNIDGGDATVIPVQTINGGNA